MSEPPGYRALNDIERMLSEHACQRLCVLFHLNVDVYDHQGIERLFCEDAIWHHKSGVLNGRAKIASYLASKSTYPVVRHLVSNVLINVVDEKHANGTAYVTVFYAEPTEDPPLLQAPIVMVTYHDTFICTSDGWRFASRRPVITLQSTAFARMINTKDDELRLRKG